ncbi:hypothetical protein H5410_027012, partial [Solanum commersonii]
MKAMKSTKRRIADIFGLFERETWVQLERVNLSPFPTHSARESEWAKEEVVFNAIARCSRETELIR